ncbi:MAG TPA: SDR family NAD(P)-dependent oxidoreductase [Terriglobales bacterium]|nr:SDR family NAD(P)-dependent oxidoreductase [Terriglobales bacterium]
MNSTLSGQVAIVTGAGRGLGRQIALTFARAGAAVVLAARTCEQLDEVGGLITSEGGKAIAVKTDVSDRDSVKRMVAQSIAELKRVDILVNNAASANYISSLALSDDARWMKMFDVNVFGTYLCSKAVISHMIRARSGRIINISSIAGQAGAPHASAYSASKAAIIGFTKAIALEVAKLGITCNAICPWHVDTELMRDAMASRGAMFGKSADEYLEQITAHNPQRRLITAEEVAGLALFLSTPEARGINGQTINQCGGMVTS